MEGEVAPDGYQESQDANNRVFEEIRARKENEIMRQQQIVEINQSIAENTYRKELLTESNSNASSAVGVGYSKNTYYVNTNSGNDPRIRLTRDMHPLNPDECDVYRNLVDAAEYSWIKAMPNHHINEDGEAEGFRYTCSGRDLANCLPITRKMFFRYSMTECSQSRVTFPSQWVEASETASEAGELEERQELEDGQEEICEKKLQTVQEVGEGDEDGLAVHTSGEDEGDGLATQTSGEEEGDGLAIHTPVNKEVETFESDSTSTAGMFSYDHLKNILAESTPTVTVFEYDRLKNLLEVIRSEKATSRPVSSHEKVRQMHHTISESGGSVRGESIFGSSTENPVILNLLQHKQEVKMKLLKVVQDIYRESLGKECTFDCMPDNSEVISEDTDCPSGQLSHQPLAGVYMSRKSADSKPWSPEIPEMVGLFHGYVRGFNKDCRYHKLFIVTSGGCSLLSDTYFNLSVDARKNMTVREVYDSEETWYLRRANQRNNAMVIKRVAEEFQLPIPLLPDPFSYEPVEIAGTTTETLHYDLLREPNDNGISFMSKCVDTSGCKNGIVCNMHPSEGVWLFRGPVKTNSAMSYYGGAFGSSEKQTSFPISTCRVRPNYNWTCKSVPGAEVCQGSPCFINSKDDSSVVRIDSSGNVVSQVNAKYTYVDETYTRMLMEESMWTRDNGIVELLPIAVVVQE